MSPSEMFYGVVVLCAFAAFIVSLAGAQMFGRGKE